jgi:probable phosphoglycerate mutase
MTTLLLVRHGETVDNARSIMQGQTQGALNEEGIRQAHDLAQQLKDEPIDAFVASDLKRSVDTCQILAALHSKSVATTPLLRERDWGSFTGRYIPDLKGEVWPDDIESLDALLARARTFLYYIKETYPNQLVVAVGHGIINKAIQAVHFRKTMPEVARMTNCEVRRLQL